jgi:molybdenum transport protein
MSSARMIPWPAWQAGLHDEPLRALLREDAPHGDLTTRALGLGDRSARIRFQARGDMRLSGMEAAARLLQLCGVDARPLRPSGQAVAAGEALLVGQGLAEGVLLGWKTAQTLVEACSGIATATAAIVARLRDAGHPTPLACTRKNFPGTRWLAAQAVAAGGGVMHRLGLSETLLVFPEHRALMADDEWPQRLADLRQSQPEKRVVVEVGTLADALLCAQHGADVLQLERFSPDQVRALRRQLQDAGLHARLAPAGGVTLANALAYAEAGADLLVSSAPLLAPPADVQVSITAV